MPEGDTVHQLAQLLREGLEGRALTQGGVCADPESSFAGRKVHGVYARGKHLFVELEGELLLRTHLGMHGSWHRYAPREPWRKATRRASVVLETDDEVYVLFDAHEVQRMRANVGAGPRRTRASRSPEDALRVYERAGRPCLACEAPIERANLGLNARSTYWCPECQAPV